MPTRNPPPAAENPSAPANNEATTPAVPQNLPAEVTPPRQTGEQPSAPPPAATPAPPDITEPLGRAVKSYNDAVAALGGPGADKARGTLRQQQASMAALCKSNQLELAQCLAQYGLSLTPVPAADAPGGRPIVVARSSRSR